MCRVGGGGAKLATSDFLLSHAVLRHGTSCLTDSSTIHAQTSHLKSTFLYSVRTLSKITHTVQHVTFGHAIVFAAHNLQIVSAKRPHLLVAQNIRQSSVQCAGNLGPHIWYSALCLKM